MVCAAEWRNPYPLCVLFICWLVPVPRALGRTNDEANFQQFRTQRDNNNNNSANHTRHSRHTANYGHEKGRVTRVKWVNWLEQQLIPQCVRVYGVMLLAFLGWTNSKVFERQKRIFTRSEYFSDFFWFVRARVPVADMSKAATFSSNVQHDA